MPSKKLLVEMGKFNEALVRAGVLLAGEGLRLLDVAVQLKGGGDRVGQTMPESP